MHSAIIIFVKRAMITDFPPNSFSVYAERKEIGILVR